jgi:hypothetical protein
MPPFFGSRSRQVAPFNPLIEIINSNDEKKNLKKLLEIVKTGLFQIHFDNLKSDDRDKMNAKLALLNRMMKEAVEEESEEEEEERFSDVMKNKYSPPLTRKTKGGKRSHTKKHKHKRHTKKQKHKRTHRR